MAYICAKFYRGTKNHMAQAILPSKFDSTKSKMAAAAILKFTLTATTRSLLNIFKQNLARRLILMIYPKVISAAIASVCIRSYLLWITAYSAHEDRCVLNIHRFCEVTWVCVCVCELFSSIWWNRRETISSHVTNRR